MRCLILSFLIWQLLFGIYFISFIIIIIIIIIINIM